MRGKSSAGSRKHHQSLRLKSNEARLNLAVDMSSTITTLSLDSIRDQYPRISKARLFELARKRFRSRTTSQQHVEDIRAILAHTRVNKRKIIDRTRKEGTIEIFREIIRPVQTQRKGNRAVRLHDNSVKTLQRSERDSLPRLKPFVREKRDRFD
jgi:hypothetical protein